MYRPLKPNGFENHLEWSKTCDLKCHLLTYARSLGVITVFLSLLQLIPSASAQQLTGPVSRETSGTGTQGQRIESIAPTRPYPTKSLEKNDAQPSTRRPHRIIPKPQNAPIASVEPSPSGSSPVNSLPTPPPSLQSDNVTSQSKEPSSFNRSVGVARASCHHERRTVISNNHEIHCRRHSINRNHPAGRCRRGQLVYLRKRRRRWANDAKISCGDAGAGTIELATLSPGTVSQYLIRHVDMECQYGKQLGWVQNLSRNDSGGYGAPIATLQGNITTYIAAGLQSGTTYMFVITAYDSDGNQSPRSNEVSKSIY